MTSSIKRRGSRGSTRSFAPRKRRGTGAPQAGWPPSPRGAFTAAPLGPMPLNTLLGRVDVPVYLATSFADRLVLPNPVVAAYRALRARLADRRDPYKEDLRLLISDEAHGDDGGNFAVTDDIFTWI